MIIGRGRGRADRSRRAGWKRAGLAGLAVTMSMATVGGRAAPSSADSIVAGTAGTDTALPETDSAITVHGTGAFAKVEFKVNQTKSLTNQAISVTWRGATPPADAGSPFFDHFMQIFQCWGDDGGPHNPGPPREQCEFGGSTSAPNGGTPREAGENTATRNLGVFRGAAGEVPFRGVDGTVIPKAFGLPPNADQFHQSVWLNPFFDLTNTNEDAWAEVFPNGAGSQLFQVDTGLEAPGLGCGQKTQKLADGSKVVPRCWLVMVPRGGAATENLGTNPGQSVQTSPLSDSAWPNRISIPLEFNPVDSPCAIGADQRRLVGSELAASAIGSWQPVLCATPGAPPYSFAPVADRLARQQVVTGVTGMAVVSRPVGTEPTAAATGVVYAPLSLSGVVVGFNIERQTTSNAISKAERDAESPLNGSKVAHINLTPRLVAKLLTESYVTQVKIGGGSLPPGYDWAKANPSDLTGDEEFLRYNPEFRDLTTVNRRTFGGAIVEETSSDSAHELWRWILADPEAKAWLAGGADPNTPPMKVNPVYGSALGFGNPVPDHFPKNDPYCWQDTFHSIGSPPQPPRPLCQLDWIPYTGTMQVAAQETGAANDGAKIAPGTGTPAALSPATFWVSAGAEIQGSRSLISVTDSASAARYGLQTASLSRSGDDSDHRSFAAPDTVGLLAGQKAMAPSPDPAVLQPSPSTTTAGAYPLTMLAYAALTPGTLDASARSDYAALINYAAGTGQVQGFKFGQLPPGYAPLPDGLRAAAKAAAASIKAYGSPAATATTPAPPASHGTTPSTAAGAGSGSAASATTSGNTSTATSTSATLAQAAGSTSAPRRGTSAVPGPIRRILRTLSQGLGLIRYTLPLTVGVGVIAAFGVFLLSTERRTSTAGPPSFPAPGPLFPPPNPADRLGGDPAQGPRAGQAGQVNSDLSIG